MYYLLYILYAGSACFALSKTKLSRQTGLAGPMFYGLFLFTVICSLGFAYYFSADAFSDYRVYNRHGWEEYKLLLRNPAAFFTNITDSHYADPYGNFFDAGGSFWNDLRNNIIIKMIALFNILSQGNFFINTLFFSLIAFCGKLALYKFFKKIYPSQRIALIIGCFLLPSTCIFLSGIHKDAVLFCLLAFFSLHVYKTITEKIQFKRIWYLIFLFLSILIIRNYVAFALLPAVLVLCIAKKSKFKPIYLFISTYALIVLFLGIVEISDSNFNPLQIITDRQKEFLSLPVSNSQLVMDSLQPSLKSFVTTTPQALNHVLLHPYISEFEGAIFQLYAIENIVYFILLMLLIIYPRKHPEHPFRNAAICFCVFLSLSMFLFIGYTIPAVGAIIRYKSLYLPFLITPILAGIDISRKSRSGED